MPDKSKEMRLIFGLTFLALSLTLATSANAQTGNTGASCSSLGLGAPNSSITIQPDYAIPDQPTPVGTTAVTPYPIVMFCAGSDPKTGTDGPRIIGGTDFKVTSTSGCANSAPGQCCTASASFTPTSAGFQRVAIVTTEHVIRSGQEISSRVRCAEFVANGVDNNRYSITKSFPDTVELAPTRYACGKDASNNEIKQELKLQCLEKQNDGTRKAVAGCKIQYAFELGDEDGGHAHGYSLRSDRFGKIPELGEGITREIPETGLILTYIAPEAAGDVKIRFAAVDSNGRQIQGLNDSLIRLRAVTNLLDLRDSSHFGFSIDSHPGDGFYGTQSLNDALANTASQYESDLTKKFPKLPIPGLSSEAGSLEWGGLFDINRDWEAPHCGHRLGTEIDISMSVFANAKNGKAAKKILARSIRDAGLALPVPVESLRNPSANHWHVRGN